MTDAPLAAAELPFETRLATPAGRAKELVRGLIAASARPLGTLVRVATRQPAIALTFDDGPHPEETPPLLEVLERHGARGTFFMVGAAAARHPELVARVAQAGHAVANHSWDHSSFRRQGGAERRQHLQRCGEALAPWGTRLFRPPYGEQSVGSLLAARRAGYEVVAWDVVAEDWLDLPAERVLERVLRRLRRGSIVVFHDALYVTENPRYRDREPTREALGLLLQRLSPRFRFVTVPELLRLGRAVYWHHYHRLPGELYRQLGA